MTFRDQTLTDFKNCLLNTGEFAEAVVYTPSGGSPKTVNAIVVRERIESKGPDHTIALSRGAEIYIANDAALGTASINKNNDTVSFPVQIGGTAVVWKVVEIIYHDDAVWRLRVIK